jgi:hypothetical protein
MNGANIAFLILCIFNFITPLFKWFVYFWWVLDLKGIINDVTSATTIDTSTITSVAEAEDTFQKLAETFTDLLAKFTPLHPGGLMIGSFLNMMVMGWPIIAFRGDPDMEDLGYYYTTCNAMYKTWVFVGWLPSAMFILDGLVAAPIGTGKFDGGKGGDWGWNFWLMVMESGTWFGSIIVYAWTWGAFKANFVV